MRFKLIVLAISIVAIYCAIDDEDAKNDQDEVVFRVMDENRIRLPNRHRSKKPNLKMSLHGATIEKIEKQHNSTQQWTLEMSDRVLVDISVVEVKGSNITEYILVWHGGGPNEKRELCFHYGFNHAFWYNGYQSHNASWPMDTEKAVSKQQFNYLFDYDRFMMIFGDHDEEFIFILEHLFLNSDGFAILLDHHSPLFIRRNQNGDDPLICFSVNNVYPYMADNQNSSYLDIKVHIFASTNIRTVTDYTVHHSGYLPKPTVVPNESLFTQTLWSMYEMLYYARENIQSFSSKLTDKGFSSKSKIIFAGSEYWKTNYLEELVKIDQFPQENLIFDLHKSGFEVGINLFDVNLVKHQSNLKYCTPIYCYVDFSNPQACQFFAVKLTNFRFEKQIDLYMFSAANYLRETNALQDTFVRMFPSLLTTRFLETLCQVGSSIISEYAFKSQHLPVWVRLTNYKNSPYKKLLLELIPNVLSVSIAGYSFFVPYSVGGFYFLGDISEEIFIRMLQAITFMPSISFGKEPWHYSQQTVDLVKKYVNLHMEHAPTMLELAKKRITDGSPIVRPLWYVSPDDPETYKIGDQYMLGQDILVAPVVVPGQTERTVYLPAGTWIDQHGKSYQGPAKFKVAAPLEELPYFKRRHL